MHVMASSDGSGFGLIGIIYLAIVALMLASFWKVFTKAGKPGWASLVPFYNLYVMLQIAGKPGWWMILMFIPFVNLIVSILVIVAFARAFGKGGGFAAGLLFLPFVFYPMLAFGAAEYQGAAAS